MNPSSPSFGWAILAATFLGPIFAVLATRYIDRQRDRHQRQLGILRTLMATRRTLTSPEHVSALNLIEIEFHGNRKVLECWKNYFRHLATGFDPKEVDKVVRERQALLAKLLYEMARVVKVNIEQLDILGGGYIPQGMLNVEQENQTIRTLLTELLTGKRSMPIDLRSTPPPPSSA